MIWHTEVRKISELKNWESNPRTISEESYKTLKKSIGDLGNFEPLVINIDGTVLAGNQRLRVHKEQGDTEVEVSVPERELTEEEIKKIGIISNRHSGEWDMDKLANEFEDVLEELGFDDLMPEVELDVKEDDYEEPEELPIRVKLGEVWQLGKHRLMCGDSTKIEDVEKLMDGQKADMVFTDPPYSVNYEKKNKEVLKSKSYTHIENDDMEVSDIARELWKPVFDNLALISEDYASIYVTMPQGGDQMMMMMMMDSWQVKHELIWVKPSPVFSMGRLDYDYKHEPILYGWKKSHRFYGKGEFTKSVWEIGRDGDKSHPTMKPIALMSNAILNNTQKGERVVDVFGGSGSTLIACEQTNRVCYMMELDEHYATVILDRWEKLTGEQGTKLE